MRRMLREIGRAPGRILVSTFALALAVAAIGVFAIPAVAAGSLRDAIERDGVVNLVVGTSDTGRTDVAALVESVTNVELAEAQVVLDVPTADGESSRTIIGMGFGDQQLNVVRATAGRLPERANEILVPDGATAIGTSIAVRTAAGERVVLEVVGIGGTSFFDGDDDVVYASLATARNLGGLDGVNRLAVRAIDASAPALRVMSDDIRTALADNGIVFQYLPVTIADGIHPVEAEIEQVSSLIGMLGVVAGIVGLVLLASTTNTLMVERSREIAVMRALGAAPRVLRRRLRRLAIGIASVAVVVGVPLGVLLSNVIARMVLQEFVGLTPEPAVSIPVVLASAVFAIGGARVLAARSARRLTGLPLSEALRDRAGRPFGRRRIERIAMRWPAGGGIGHTAVRSATHRWARSSAIVGQVGAGVAALLVVGSMATTINDFNRAEIDPWRWNSMTSITGPGLDIDAAAAAASPRTETAIEVVGQAQDWEVDVYGFERATRMVDGTVVDGSWFEAPGEVVVSRGFAQHVGIEVGDRVEILLASGPHSYEVAGLHANRGREFYLDRGELGTDLGDPGGANRLFSLDPDPGVDVGGVTETIRLDDVRGDDSGRTAILLIFGAIGVVVVAVAGLAVASGVAVSIYERRHEFAALQAIGGRRRHVVRLVATETIGLGVVGLAVGVVGGFLGGRAIARSFEVSNAVEIGFVFATGAVPAIAGVVVIGLGLLAAAMVRPATRRPIAATLRAGA